MSYHFAAIDSPHGLNLTGSARSLHNLLALYAPSVTRARCFMNAGGTPEPVFEQTGAQRHILDDRHFNTLVKEARP